MLTACSGGGDGGGSSGSGTNNNVPVASSASYTTSEDTALSATLSAADADSNPLTFRILTNGTKGTAAITNPATGAFTYTPNPNSNGSDSFTFVVNDGTVDSNVATVTMSVTPVNDAPIANAGFDQLVNAGAPVPLTGSGTDVDGTITGYQWVQTAGPTVTLSNPNNASTTFTAPPATPSWTVLTFQLTVTDSGGATGTDTVNVSHNLPPVANNACVSSPSDYTAGLPISGTLTGSDPDGGPLVFSILSSTGTQLKGSAAIDVAGNFLYTPKPGTTPLGMDKFLFTVTDNRGQQATGAAWVFIGGTNNDPPAAVRIMPLGDSITSGIVDGASLTPPVSDRVGYRGALNTSLANAGYPTDFVGSLDMGYALFSDSQHEGHGGWTDEEIANGRVGVPNSGIYNWLTQKPADIILLHIGTNSLDPNGQADVAAILDQIDLWEQNAGQYPVQVFLARIIDENPTNPDVTTYNNNVQAMALDRVNNNANPAYPDQIVIVDQHSALTYPTDLADQVHPNATGYGKMAARWVEALQQPLPPPPQGPPLWPPQCP
jgi:lysophospholipase L1-like esterase